MTTLLFVTNKGIWMSPSFINPFIEHNIIANEF